MKRPSFEGNLSRGGKDGKVMKWHSFFRGAPPFWADHLGPTSERRGCQLREIV